jgi:integrase
MIQRRRSKHAPKAKPTTKRGQMRPLTIEQVSALEAMLRQDGSDTAVRDLALLRVGIDSMLRSSDVLALTLRDVRPNGGIARRISVLPKKTKRTGKHVQFGISDKTKSALESWIVKNSQMKPEDRLFPITTRQHQRIVKQWIALLGLDPVLYSTHSIRRTKSTHLYEQTKNIEVVKRLLGHASLAATGEYLGVTNEDALDLAERFPI